MAWTYTMDTATPAGSDDPKAGDDRIREAKAALQERLAVDHVFALTGTEVSGAHTGKHNKITMPEVAAPTPVEDYGHLYSMNVSGVTELFWVGGTGTPKQLTSGGKINNATADLALSVLLAGAQDIAGAKTFKTGAVQTFEDPVVVATPTGDTHAATKKYVDDSVDTITIDEKTSGYTLVLTDVGKMIDMSSAIALTLTVPKNSSVAFDIGTIIAIRQKGAGAVTIAPVDSDVTINTEFGLLFTGQYGVACLLKITSDIWVAFGSLEAA